MEQVMITLPNDLLRAVGETTRLRRQAIEARLAEEYAFFAQETATLVADSLPAQTAAAEKVWQ